MTTCPTCGFDNPDDKATTCPECGLPYAELADLSEKEESCGESLAEDFYPRFAERLMERENTPETPADREWDRDQTTYPGILYLSWFFYGFALVLGFGWIVGISFFRRYLAGLEGVDPSDRLYLILLFAIVSSMPMALYLAIGAVLRLGKDIADNTRAARSHLARIVNRSE